MTSTVGSQAEAQIRELVADRETAMQQADVERLVARLAPETVRFGLAPPLAQSGPEVRDMNGLQTWFDTFDGPIEFEIRDLSVTVAADVGFCHSLNRLTATPLGAPESFTLWFRSTLGLRKIDGTWQITHEHDSTPFYMDGSFNSAVDLQP